MSVSFGYSWPLTYLFPQIFDCNVQFFGFILEPPTYPKMRRHLCTCPYKRILQTLGLQNYDYFFHSKRGQWNWGSSCHFLSFQFANWLHNSNYCLSLTQVSLSESVSQSTLYKYWAQNWLFDLRKRRGRTSLHK